MVIIEGVAFPLDNINKNRWGVPAAEADSAISSLKNLGSQFVRHNTL